MKLPLPDSRALSSASQIEEGGGFFEMHFKPGEQIVVIDDDASMQLQWELTFRRKQLAPLSYDSYEDFEWKKAERPPLRSAVIDFHFDNSELNGFEIISRLRSQGFSNIYLCTGEYWKPIVQKQAKDMKISICPKPLPKIVIVLG